jgi:hypothetical protein
MDITLSNAKAWLQPRANGTEYGEKMRDSYVLMGFEDDQPLKSYLDAIVENPQEWIMKTPQTWRSLQAYNKLRSAINNMMKDAHFKSSFGDEYCANVVKTMKDTVKQANVDRVNREKSPGDVSAEEVVSGEVSEADFVVETALSTGENRADVLMKKLNEQDKVIRRTQRLNSIMMEYIKGTMDDNTRKLFMALLAATD